MPFFAIEFGSTAFLMCCSRYGVSILVGCLLGAGILVWIKHDGGFPEKTAFEAKLQQELSKFGGWTRTIVRRWDDKAQNVSVESFKNDRYVRWSLINLGRNLGKMDVFIRPWPYTQSPTKSVGTRIHIDYGHDLAIKNVRAQRFSGGGQAAHDVSITTDAEQSAISLANELVSAIREAMK